MYTVRGSRAAITMLMILVSMLMYMSVNQELSSVLAFSSTKKTTKTMTNNSSNSSTIKNRREVLARIIGGTGIAALELAYVATPAEAKAKKEDTVVNMAPPAVPAVPVPALASETEQEKQARMTKEKIAASKINYRKAESKDKSPFRLLEKNK